MDLSIRPEEEKDHPAVREVLDEAFGQQDEGKLVERLGHNPGFIPGLSLVAAVDDHVNGYILLLPPGTIITNPCPWPPWLWPPVFRGKALEGGSRWRDSGGRPGNSIMRCNKCR